MTSVNTGEEDRLPILNHRTPCLHSSNLVLCTCDDLPPDDSEHSPLISYQNHTVGSDRYLTEIHCHEAKPIYSNARARRKLLIASIVCLLFVVAEVVGKVLTNRNLRMFLVTFASQLSCAFKAPPGYVIIIASTSISWVRGKIQRPHVFSSI